jgi:plastocyanin
MPRLPIIAVACTALALALGACGKDKESQTGRDAGEDGATVQTNPTPQAQTSTQSEGQKSNDIVSVTMKDIKFVPETITAKVGQKIVWTNEDQVAHNVTAKQGAKFASDTLQKDQTFEYTPTKAGTIKYVCTIHPGQNGQITVTK